MARMTIDLGKGVTLTAPIKLNMTAEEWVRMVNYINGLVASRKR